MKADLNQISTVILPWGIEDVKSENSFIRGRDAGGMRSVTTCPIIHNREKVGEYKDIETLAYHINKAEEVYDRSIEITIGNKTKVRKIVGDVFPYKYPVTFAEDTITKKTPEFELVKSKYDSKYVLESYKNLISGFSVKDLTHEPNFVNHFELLSDVALGEKVSFSGISKGEAKQILTKLFKKCFK